MMKLLVCLTVLLLTLGHFTVLSVPIRDMQQPVKVTRREALNDESTTFSHELANASLPEYLKDLYVNFSFPHGPFKDQKIIAANTIRSYKNQALSSTSCGYYKFAMDKAIIAEGEKIIHAELRLLQKISMPGDYYEVNIHYLLNHDNINSPLKLTFKNVGSSSGWKTFDITQIVDNWKQGWVNYGLKVTLTKGEQHLPCEGVYSSGEEEDILNTEPLLVVFTYDLENKLLTDALQDTSVTKHKKGKRQTSETNSIKPSHVACHLQTLEVNNTAVTTGDVHLIIPKVLDVGVCGGHCPRLQVESLTDYASILSLHYYQTRGHRGAPKRCCVPTNFELIQMVFYNEVTSETIYKNVPIKATTCGCI